MFRTAVFDAFLLALTACVDDRSFGFQVRSKVSTFGGGFGGPTEVTSGGNALKFYASIRLNIKRIGLVKKGDEVSAAANSFLFPCQKL